MSSSKVLRHTHGSATIAGVLRAASAHGIRGLRHALASALTLVFALALGGCHADIAQVGEHADIARVDQAGIDVAAGQLLAMDSGPSCYFGSPAYPELPVTRYWGFLYRNPDPDMELPDGRQIVDLKGHLSWTHDHDLITWVCTGLGPYERPSVHLTADDPADLEGFSLQPWSVPGSLQSFARVLYEGPLPGPPSPGYWRELVVQLRSGYSFAPLATAPLNVQVCDHPRPQDPPPDDLEPPGCVPPLEPPPAG